MPQQWLPARMKRRSMHGFFLIYPWRYGLRIKLSSQVNELSIYYHNTLSIDIVYNHLNMVFNETYNVFLNFCKKGKRFI